MFQKKSYRKNKKNGLRFSIVDLRAPWAPYFMSLDIENSLSEPRVELRWRLRKWFAKHPSKTFFFSKFLNLCPGLPRRRSQPKIAARWRYRPPIKNLTSHYNSQFCVSFHCCFFQEAQKRLWTCPNGAET